MKIWVRPKAVFFRLVKHAVLSNLLAPFPSRIKKKYGASVMQLKSNYTVLILPLSLPSPPVLLKTNKNKRKENEQKQAGEKKGRRGFSVPKCYIIIGG